jgi:hypothetical protein
LKGRRKIWVVVEYTKRGPVCVDGIYSSRAEALSVREGNKEELYPGIKGRVVELTLLMSPKQFKKYLHA